MEWVPVLTALIAAVSTLGGVAITQAYASAREARLDSVRRQDEAVADLRTEARVVSDLFLAESIEYERIAHETLDTGDFDTKYDAHLYAGSLYRLGQAINMLPDAEARAQLRMLVGNLPERNGFPSILLGIANWAVTVPLLLNAAQDISSAYARGERPDLDGSKWYRRIEAASAQRDAELAAAKAMHPAFIMRQAAERAAQQTGE